MHAGVNDIMETVFRLSSRLFAKISGLTTNHKHQNGQNCMH